MGRAARERERAASAGARNSLGSKKQSKSRIVPLQQEDSKNPNAARHDIDGGTAGAVVKKTGWGPDSRKGADLETGESGNPLEDAKQAANVPVGVTDCVSAYSFTCSSIENFFNCCCPHRRHVPRVIYLVTVAIVFAGLLITLFIGVACQVRAVHDIFMLSLMTCALCFAYYSRRLFFWLLPSAILTVFTVANTGSIYFVACTGRRKREKSHLIVTCLCPLPRHLSRRQLVCHWLIHIID